MPFRSSLTLLASAAIATGTIGIASTKAAEQHRGKSTVQRTIVGDKKRGQRFTYLKAGKGEPYKLRTDLAKPKSNRRDDKRRSLIYFTQLTDLQLVDKESPVRIEYLANLGGNFKAGWRPHESLMPHTADSAIDQINAFQRSPLKSGGKRAKMALAMLTGDNIDNGQANEAGWLLTLLHGGPINPASSSGAAATGAYDFCKFATASKFTPLGYHGIQSYKGPGRIQDFYHPDTPSGDFRGWPSYPGLLERAQRPFKARGLKVPSYLVVGNHDSMVQGGQGVNPLFDLAVKSCIKPVSYSLDSDPTANRPDQILAEMAADPAQSFIVPPNPARRFLDKLTYKQAFMSRQSDGHGFKYVERKELKASNGAASYYTFDPKPGIRFIVLDTVSEAGVLKVSDEGNLDHPQYRWFERQLKTATKANKLVVVFSHHPPQSMVANVADEVAGKCTSKPSEPARPAGCRRDPRKSTPIHLGKSVSSLIQKYPHAIAWVAGHEHRNTIMPMQRKGGGGYWSIRTASEADWPQQNRLLELMDNRDGTLSIFGTILDVATPIAAPKSGTRAKDMSSKQLASISRTLSFNDLNRKYEKSSGTPLDRNVELIVNDPRRK